MATKPQREEKPLPKMDFDKANTCLVQQYAQHEAGKRESLAALIELDMQAQETARRCRVGMTYLAPRVDKWIDAGAPNDPAEERAADAFIALEAKWQDAAKTAAFCHDKLERYLAEEVINARN